MEKVTGIGGVFFRAANPQALSEWYLAHLGIDPVPSSEAQRPWVQEAGPTVFAPFEQNTDYFGRETQSWMINFRVRDLTRMVAQLREAGIEVSMVDEDLSIGRFARLHDPEGNPIELWEPSQRRGG
ncbi:VOC family protein [Pseudohalioglobus sediminis]|uniref:VOC family protein n=1 Tax=Pseudohalioglobus sediminis TaxID=2606449 RepID=A0A5B0WSJ4_9GAMM|nr:VOC family protein [Pseudohalioglobus sediminis]KAA1189994.1 VOC family protein [Pseudohalioglobus sediminis]